MKLLLSILFILNISFGSIVLSQEDSISGENYYIDKAIYWYGNNNLDSVFYYFEKGLDIYRQSSNWENYLQCLNGLAASYHVSGDYVKMFELVNEAQSIAPLLPNKKTEAYSSLLNNMAAILSNKNEFEKALQLLEEALSIEKELGKVEKQIAVLRNIGSIYLNKGDYDEALIYNTEALRIQTQELKVINPNLALSYSSIADIYRFQSKYKKAIELLNKSLSILEGLPNKTDKTNVKQRIGAHLKLGQIYSVLKSQTLFEYHLKEAQNLEQKYQDKKSSEPEMILGDWYLQNGKPDLAFKEFNTALEIRKINFESFDIHPDLGEAYFKIGQFQFENMNLREGLKFFQKALVNYSSEFTPKDDYINPELDQLNLDNETLNILHYKAKLLMSMYQEDTKQKSNYLILSKKTFHLCIKVLDRIRRNYLSPRSKEVISAQAEEIYANAIACYYTLFEEHPTENHKNDIFELMEANKASILFESINETFAKEYSGIPDSLKILERNIRNEISFYRKTIAENKANNSEKIEVLRTALFSKRRAYQNLIKRFEDEYPNYYQLKYGDSSFSLIDVQNVLSDQTTCIIEYYIDKDKLYAILITKDGSRIITTNIDRDLESYIIEFSQLVASPPKNKNAKQDYLKFNRLSNSIYRCLIEPLNIEDHIEQLIIIPDESIAHLPFEILISQSKEGSNVNYNGSNLDYLINDFGFSYNYSVKLYLQSQRREFQSTKNMLSFAPEFKRASSENYEIRNCSGESLFALKCAKEESKQIGNLFEGEILSDGAATKSAFLEKAPNYKMLHLATHACIDEDDPMLSKIFFSNEEYITNYELFNLDLNAELVVLSACNTGVGNLIEGEGILNLNRGFLQAGCPSSVISLWSIDDCSSKNIITYYYENIKNGFTKSVSIRQAKLDYLKEASVLNKHPFYWSAFIQYGDISRIEMPRKNKRFKIIAFCLLIILIVGFLLHYYSHKEISN